MSDTLNTSPPLTAKAADNITLSGHSEASHDHLFVQPSTYLRPEHRTVELEPLTPRDREQMHGLASILRHFEITTKKPYEHMRGEVYPYVRLTSALPDGNSRLS